MTFSIAGRCARTGQFGVALATSSIGAGGRCPHLRPGVGAVLTQARTDPRLGPLGLGLLAGGCGAQQTIDSLVAATPHANWRQLAVLTAAGDAACWTGADVGRPADGMTLDGAVVVGNWVKSETVIAAIAAGYETDPLAELADRLVQGLEGGEQEGGELDPLQSAAVVVCDPAYGFPVIDLRVDLSADPIRDLREAWERWRPIMDGYLQRAVDPANAPMTQVLEGHAKP
ncbi:MAG: DUF1028 domain-containing protein [Thalassobaculum sp.]|uniref:DUF1028 domain-containing protein n=1 Tax=Thalassobaculum sp. TaxID=2022740 RepID=UPI0032ED6950